ncbi:MAG: hypothetical protein AB7O24_14780 [Kofleriaceae bacterium]
MDTVLSVPSRALGGFAPCPFAKHALKATRIDIKRIEGTALERTLHELADSWSDEVELLFLAADPREIDPVTVEGIIEEANLRLIQRDLIAMDDHPEAVPTLGRVRTTNATYLLVFVQRLSKLEAASSQLKELGYYAQWSHEEMELVPGWRQRLIERVAQLGDAKSGGGEVAALRERVRRLELERSMLQRLLVERVADGLK